MSAYENKINSDIQWFTLILLLLIARRLLFKNIDSVQDRKDLKDFTDAKKFVQDFFNGGSEL